MEKLPVTDARGATAVPGLFVVGDLRGVPLLKFAADSGARAVREIADDPTFAEERRPTEPGLWDLVVVGGGVAGMAAALEAQKRGLSCVVLEASEMFSTLSNFPVQKPILTYPEDMTPAGDLRITAPVKEALLEELRAQVRAAGIVPRIANAERVQRKGSFLEVLVTGGDPVRARRVIAALGRSGNFRSLNVPGEKSGKVFNRLHDPKEFSGRSVLVVGGGDSAVEAALALEKAGARVTLSYRKNQLARPKPENVEALSTAVGGKGPGSLRLALGTQVREILPDTVVLVGPAGGEERLANDAVFSLIGREAPLEFFRRSGVPIQGEGSRAGRWALGFFLAAVALLYDWKAHGFLSRFYDLCPWPENTPALLASFGESWARWTSDRSTLLGTLAVSLKSRSFYYTAAYTALIGFFGWRRVKRRNTPYVRRQTWTLFWVQAIPLFLLPEILLPWLGYNGVFSQGWGAKLADLFFEKYISAGDYAAGLWPTWGHPRAYWRAYGFVLAFPLNVYNVFTAHPLPAWLAVSFVQTFVLIPWAIFYFGKGVYCGWICSCGALAETLGDTQRSKMPHGPEANKLNRIGQVFLAGSLVLLLWRIVGWVWPHVGMEALFALSFEGKRAGGGLNPFSYKWIVDILFGGVLGVGLYFKYSGRVWCRFACPLAALMHVYTRFSRFRIFPDKKKCISCNVCTSVCHMGIDVMNFANKGLPMADPECVRCSACVQSCPTQVLQFGRLLPDGGPRWDRINAQSSSSLGPSPSPPS